MIALLDPALAEAQRLIYPFYARSLTDGGRSESPWPKARNDCTVRALAITCDIPYREAYIGLREAGRVGGQGFHMRPWAAQAVVNDRRFVWRAFQAVRGEPRMNPPTFSREYDKGVWIVKTAKHVIAVIDGVFYDTFDAYPERCIYGAWEVIHTPQEPS